MLIPEIDPIAIQIGPLAIRWYGLTWLAAFSSIYFLIQRKRSVLKSPKSNNSQFGAD